MRRDRGNEIRRGIKLASELILGPRGDQKWIPREISCRSHLFSQFFDGIFENRDFLNPILHKINYNLLK